MRTPLLILAAAAAAACTTLGPTPVTTGLSARPLPRAGVDVQAGVVPGFHLSQAVVEDPDSAGIGQLSVVVQHDALFDAPGLVVGARVFGEDGDAPLEPVIGFRRELGPDGRAALGGFLYGTHAEAADDGAAYAATRFGGELAGDVRVLAPGRWVEPHLFAAFNLTYLDVRGTYCVDDARRWGVDCAAPPDPPRPTATSTVTGTFPAAHVGAALELVRHRRSWFHGARVAVLAAGGTLPRVESGRPISPEAYVAFGVTLSVGVGAGDGD